MPGFLFFTGDMSYDNITLIVPNSATTLDERYSWLCLRYIEQNPDHAGLVKKVQDYPWSSGATHCGFQDDPTLAQGMASLEKRGWTSGEVKKPVFIGKRIVLCPNYPN
jgi:hypothetical protein